MQADAIDSSGTLAADATLAQVTRLYSACIKKVRPGVSAYAASASAPILAISPGDHANIARRRAGVHVAPAASISVCQALHAADAADGQPSRMPRGAGNIDSFAVWAMLVTHFSSVKVSRRQHQYGQPRPSSTSITHQDVTQMASGL